jgi:hypothetical protein
MRFSPCRPRSGNGWFRGRTGNAWRRFCRPARGFQKSEALACDRAAIEEEMEQAKQTLKPKALRKPRARAGRQPLPPHLPRVEHHHEPESCQCGRCGSELVKIGEDISERCYPFI